MEFKDRIRELREERAMSTTQLGGMLDKSDAAIRMWETGRSKPDADTLITLGDFFGVPIDYLLGRTDARHPKNMTMMEELGLSDKSIEMLKADTLEAQEEGDSRILRDVMNMVLSDSRFFTLLEWVQAVTIPGPDHIDDTQWMESPSEVSFSPESSDYQQRLRETAFKKYAHDALDSIIKNVGDESLKQWQRDNKASKKGALGKKEE